MNDGVRLSLTHLSCERKHGGMWSLMEHHFLLFLSLLSLLLVIKLPQSCGLQLPSIEQFLSMAPFESSWGVLLSGRSWSMVPVLLQAAYCLHLCGEMERPRF